MQSGHSTKRERGAIGREGVRRGKEGRGEGRETISSCVTLCLLFVFERRSGVYLYKGVELQLCYQANSRRAPTISRKRHDEGTRLARLLALGARVRTRRRRCKPIATLDLKKEARRSAARALMRGYAQLNQPLARLKLDLGEPTALYCYCQAKRREVDTPSECITRRDLERNACIARRLR